MVLLWKSVLLNKLHIQPFDSELMKQLKTRLNIALNQKMEITSIHKLALFLHPQYTSLKKLPMDDRLGVHQMARQYIAMLNHNDAVRRTSNEGGESSSRYFNNINRWCLAHFMR